MTKPRILVPTPFFPPAFKSGGAAKSVGNLVAALGDEYRFLVHTLSCDIDGTPLEVSSTRDMGASTITYHAPGAFRRATAAQLMDEVDLVYLNGFFAPAFSLNVALARRMKRRRPPLLVAPRGELFRPTLNHKAIKKRIGMAAIRAAGLYRDAEWHGSDATEGQAIAAVARRLGQSRSTIHCAFDLAGQGAALFDPPHRDILRLVYFARIAPKKNLDFALRVLARVPEPVELDIIGPIEDQAYWDGCAALIAELPSRHRVRQLGPITPDAVASTLATYDLYLFPTQSENYGHTIQEALAAGLPALISDATPWRDLERAGAGWDLPLVEADFAQALGRFARLGEEGRRAMRAAARRTSRLLGQADAVNAHRAMFDGMLGRS